MALRAGTRLGSYEIQSAIGRGGMGEVYRARDTKLGRAVAIKVLPDAVATDRDRVARFEREARVLATLNHPHIATLHGLEQAVPSTPSTAADHASPSQAVHFLIMELVGGDTLADRLRAGPVPIAEALGIALQIADALEAAHEKGIVHRDLKPANVKLRPDGIVKVLDFGLAKALADDNGSDPTNSPTETAVGSEIGVLMGTAAYMSPEQARGQTVDKRTDIWAFGCVLYEMVAGRRVFERQTVTDTLAAILTDAPSFAALPASTPDGIRALLRRCLERDRLRRLRDIGEARIAIEDAITPAAISANATPRKSPKPVWRRSVPALAVAGLIAPLAGVVGWSLRSPAPAPSMRFDLVLPEGDRLDLTTLPAVVSPNGRHVAYKAIRSGQTQLFLRAIGESQARTIQEQLLDISSPFFSPDGQSIGFFDVGKLRRVAVGSGVLADISEIGKGPAFRGTWGRDDTIVFNDGGLFKQGGLLRVRAAGGKPQSLTMPRPDRKEQYLRWPEMLPDGRSVVFGSVPIDAASYDEARVEILSLETGDRQTLIQNAYDPRYARTGHLLFARAKDVYAVPLDISRLELTGEPVRVLTGVSGSVYGDAYFSVSETGTLLFVPSSAAADSGTLVLVDRRGAAEPTGLVPRRYARPRVSPDGRRIVVETIDVTHTVWVFDLENRTLNRLTTTTARHEPSWMPDGRYVTFSGDQAFRRQLADGSGPEEVLAQMDETLAGSWSPDGKVFVSVRVSSETGADLWGFSPADEQKLKPVVQTRFEEYQPALSPDGRWLAYVSNETGRDEVYAREFPRPGRKWQISTEGGSEPVWARTGREIFYRQKTGMFAVDVAMAPRFVVSRPRLLFNGSYVDGTARAGYDVTPDGRFLMVKADDNRPATQMHIVLNWFEELKRLAPSN